MKTYENALILGMGASGCAAAELLLSEGCHVCVCDASSSAALAEPARMLQSKGAEVRLGETALPHRDFDVCIISPGIPLMSHWGQASLRLAKETISELELAFSRCKVPVIAITGTNGKSTCSKLIADILAANGMRPMLGGNYGVPFAHLILEQDKHDWAVIEVSSFQLEAITTFRPRIGVLLNVQPDHLTRHGSMHEYARLKASMFSYMGEGDMVVLQSGLEDEVRSLLRECVQTPGTANRAEWYTFGKTPGSDFMYAPGEVRGTLGQKTFSTPLKNASFDNPILGQTVAAAFGVACLAGVPANVVASVVDSFKPLPHRMEGMEGPDGVIYINDSKATNLAAMSAALDMCDKPVRLIAGGRLKEGHLESVKEKLGSRVRAVYLIGEASRDLENAWHDAVDCHACGNVQTAVEQAALAATADEIVLFSPGCASFDQFNGFVQRGRAFCEAVENLGRLAAAV